jgi:DNA mismatch endonuclease, patch repair protein
MDNLTSFQRSNCMSRIRSKDTSPEIVVRHISHNIGYRFRLHRSDLPGKPDLVFPRLKKIIFVHGCFWHSHNCQRGSVKPKTNSNYWEVKRKKTKNRDKMNLKDLKKLGWHCLIIWECDTKNIQKLEKSLNDFLSK